MKARYEWKRQLLRSKTALLLDEKTIVKIPLGAKVVGAALLEHVSDTTLIAYPGQALLAVECGMTERGVRGAIAFLVDSGFLTIERRRTRGPNVVKLAFPSGTVVPDRKDLYPEPDGNSLRNEPVIPSGTAVPLSIEPNNRTKEPEPKKERPAVGTLPRPSVYEGELPSGYVRTGTVGSDQNYARIFIGVAAAQLAHLTHTDRIQGIMPDAWIVNRIPDPVLRELERRCRLGALSEADLWLALVALGIVDQIVEHLAA